MKKKNFLALFIGTQLICILALIHKQSRLVKMSYTKQNLERNIASLTLKKQEITSAIHALQNHQKIKTYATQELGMTPLYLKNIKKFPVTENPST